MNNLSNHVQLVGHLGKDVETIEVGNGRKLAKARIATNYAYKNSDGELVKNTEWHQLVAWGRTAELMQTHGIKGTEICISGRLSNRSYEDKDGVKKYITEVVVNEFKAFKKGTDKPF